MTTTAEPREGTIEVAVYTHARCVHCDRSLLRYLSFATGEWGRWVHPVGDSAECRQEAQ